MSPAERGGESGTSQVLVTCPFPVPVCAFKDHTQGAQPGTAETQAGHSIRWVSMRYRHEYLEIVTF
jgi:hypothetical protein